MIRASVSGLMLLMIQQRLDGKYLAQEEDGKMIVNVNISLYINSKVISVPGTTQIGTWYQLKLYCILIVKYVTIYTVNGLGC